MKRIFSLSGYGARFRDRRRDLKTYAGNIIVSMYLTTLRDALELSILHHPMGHEHAKDLA
jgi:hypothetical protein